MSIFVTGLLFFFAIGFVFIVIPDFIRLKNRFKYEKRRKEYMQSTCIKLERPIKYYQSY